MNSSQLGFKVMAQALALVEARKCNQCWLGKRCCCFFPADELLETKRGVLQSKYLLHPTQGLQAAGGPQEGPNGPFNQEDWEGEERPHPTAASRPHHCCARKDIHQSLQACPQLRAFPTWLSPVCCVPSHSVMSDSLQPHRL